MESNSNSGKPSESPVRLKIVMIGAAKVGKSAIINQFLYNTFTPKPTVEKLRYIYIKLAGAFILVYGVNSNTFLEVKTLRDQIHSTKEAVSIVVVSNKIDLIKAEKEISFNHLFSDQTEIVILVGPKSEIRPKL
ncbi:Ras-related protein Rap-2a [Trachymyrmex zeteki]|uniref:Ras-related protein Rap-2a n=1 Tax=Mycetomoellerius zeteki TaxID=64791 RepID=A0A151XDL5_9HYME|nr:Ras-related protein Rap-2a [Trachymyrmex zeteki]